MKIIIDKIKLLDSYVKANTNLKILIIVLNCALLMDFNDFYLANLFIYVLLIVSVFLNLINTSYWFSIFFSFGFSFLNYLYRFPRQANHSNLTLFLEIFIIGLLLYYFFSSNKKPKLLIIQSIIKVSLICIYFFAGFHKLNSGYFNIDTSCANAIARLTFSNLLGSRVELFPFVIILFQYLTVLIEMVIPFGLLFKKTQKISFYILICFHTFLCWSNYADFSAFASFLLLASTINLEQKQDVYIKISWLKVYITFVLLSICTEIFIVYFDIKNITVIFYSGFVFSIGFIYFFYNYIKNLVFIPIKAISKKTILIYGTILFLFSSWSLKTYLGLGNVANLTMFSNLNSEKNHSNHYLINTKNTKIFDFEEDNVEIISLDKTLQNLDLEGYKLPLVEFKYKTSTWSKKNTNNKLEAVIVYKKDTLKIDNLSDSKFNDSKWYYKYLFFRKIEVDGETNCYW